MNQTYHAVLNAEAELILGVGPLDLHLDNRGAGHRRQLHHRLRLRVLKCGAVREGIRKVCKFI